MKVLMLNPPFVDDFCRSARWAAKSRGRVQRHPDWMLIAAAVLEREGHLVRFIDGACLNLKMGDIEREAGLFKPELAVLHTTTPTIYSDLSYAKMLKQKGCGLVVLVGPHVTAETQDTFANAKGSVDIIVRGEYDWALRDIASGRKREEIPGLSFMNDDELVNNAKREPLDVSELPFPAWKHIDPRWYYDAGKRFPFLTLISGRGCPGKCTFCRDTALIYGNKLRLRPAGSIVDEIESDYKLFPDIKEIMFETDTFAASSGHAREVCEEILKRGLKITWSCNARVDIDLSLLPLMKQAGCRMLMTGFEFGTQGALDAVKKQITLEQSRNFALTARKLGFVIHGCFMFGAPQETRESCQKTVEFASSLPLDTVQFSGICAYPGTELYSWAKEKKYLIPKDWPEWVSNDFEQATLLSYPQLNKEEIDSFIDKGLKKFYLRPAQIFRMLFNIRSIYDIKRKIYGLRQFVKYFVLKLKRKRPK